MRSFESGDTMAVERAHELARLRGECVEGRLSLGEYVRLARTALGGPLDADSDTPGDAVGALDEWVDPDDDVRAVTAVFGSMRRRIRAAVGGRLSITAIFGACRVDLTDAHVLGDELEVHATALFGTVKLVVPPGLDTDVVGTPLLGAVKDFVTASADPLPGAPRVVVRVTPVLGTVKILPA